MFQLREMDLQFEWNGKLRFLPKFTVFIIFIREVEKSFVRVSSGNGGIPHFVAMVDIPWLVEGLKRSPSPCPGDRGATFIF